MIAIDSKHASFNSDSDLGALSKQPSGRVLFEFGASALIFYLSSV